MDSSQFTDSQPQYESLEKLKTQGATCDTYRFKLYGKLHFLKRLKSEYANDIRYRESQRKEFETGYRLEHPNLVRYISLSDDGILMEYVDGETLTHWLATRPEYFLDKKNTDKLICQLLDVVGYLHQHQVLHLDLKPDNILITRINNDVKLVDLGCCYTDTFTDTLGRTNRYAAPEQLAGESTDERTDIFAIGRIIELLPNHHIYNKVIARCTAPDKADRYQSMEAFQRDICHTKTKRSYFIFPSLLLMLFIIAVCIYTLNRSDGTKSSTSETVTDSIVVTDDTIVKDSFGDYTKEETMGILNAKKSTPKLEKAVSIEQLRENIQKSILPKFNQTLGALPDSVEPGTAKWAEACKTFEPMITESLKEIILSHQTIPMTTITKEFNDYVQSLLIMKMNQVTDYNKD